MYTLNKPMCIIPYDFYVLIELLIKLNSKLLHNDTCIQYVCACLLVCVHVYVCVCNCLSVSPPQERDIPVAHWKVTLFHVVATRRSSLCIKFLVSCPGLMSDLVRLCSSLSSACPLCGHGRWLSFSFTFCPFGPLELLSTCCLLCFW